jgi:hypothetical protein
MIINIRGFLILAAIILLVSMAWSHNATGYQAQGQIVKDVPDRIDPGQRYLFYLHGRIIEERGIRPTSERWGVYEYEDILEALKQRGLVVISEARPRGTEIEAYATKVINQINALLKAGVAPRNITVVGASKGSVIAMVVSMRLKNREVNFVLMGNCNDGTLEQRQIDLWGNVLSIFDASDDIGGTYSLRKRKGLTSEKKLSSRPGWATVFFTRQ